MDARRDGVVPRGIQFRDFNDPNVGHVRFPGPNEWWWSLICKRNLLPRGSFREPCPSISRPVVWWLSIKIMWKLIRLRKAQFQKGFVLFGLGVVPVWLTATGGGCQPCFQFVSPCSGYVVAALSDDMCKDKTFLEVNVIPAEKSTSMAHLVLIEEIWAKCNLQRK